MTIKGVKSSCDPDLRATVPVPSVSSFGRISSVLVINVEEVIFLNTVYCDLDTLAISKTPMTKSHLSRIKPL